MKLATAAQMKELDRQAIEERKIPSIDLMERAAEAYLKRFWRCCLSGLPSAELLSSAVPEITAVTVLRQRVCST